MMEVSTEARFGIRGKLGGVLFVDGGNAWEGPWEVQIERVALGRRVRVSATTRRSARCVSTSAFN